MLIRILFFAVPVFFIFLFVKEYQKQRNLAKENWNNQWDEKKKNFQKEQELLKKNREIEKLKNKLAEQKRKENNEKNDPPGFSNN